MAQQKKVLQSFLYLHGRTGRCVEKFIALLDGADLSFSGIRRLEPIRKLRIHSKTVPLQDLKDLSIGKVTGKDQCK